MTVYSLLWNVEDSAHVLGVFSTLQGAQEWAAASSRGVSDPWGQNGRSLWFALAGPQSRRPGSERTGIWEIREHDIDEMVGQPFPEWWA